MKASNLKTWFEQTEDVKVIKTLPVNGVLAKGVTMFATSKKHFLRLYYDYNLKHGVIRRYNMCLTSRLLPKTFALYTENDLVHTKEFDR